MTNEKFEQKTCVGAEPLLTIIVPVYNILEYLPRCVHSITAQTYKNLEIKGNLKVSDPEDQTMTYTVTRIPKRGEVVIREDGSFDAGTLFIGDSQTFLFIEHFLKTNGLIGDAKYAVQCGSQVTAFFDTDIRPTVDRNAYYLFSPEFEGLSFSEAATQMGEDATAIYIMWGSNHTQDATAQNYIDIAAYATVHLETIPRGDVAYMEINERIRGAWEYFQSIGEPRVTMVDTFEGIGIYINSDRIHVDPQGREGWYNALVLHAETLGLVQ